MPLPGTLATRTVLLFDGVLCLVLGFGLIALRTVLAAPTGLDPAFLGGAGGVLLPVGVFILAVATGHIPVRFGLPVIVAGNVAWVAASVILPASGAIAPTGLGLAFVLLQAMAVAAIAAVEARGLRGMAVAA